jgi:chitinase
MYIHGNFAPGIHEPSIFDGIDVDWEFPASDADRKNFTALLKEFRRQLDAIRPSMTLSIASSAGSWAYQFTDLKTIQHSLSFFNLMNYDFDGPWNNTTGFVAPLYRSSKDPDPSNNADAAVEAYLELGVAPAKIVFGVPFYGYEWTGVSSVDNGLFEPGTPEGFGSGYNSIVAVESHFSRFRDPITKAPWLYDGNNFWTYDDPTSLKFKMDYVRKRHLAGVMFWEISGDLPNGTLVRTLIKGLQRKPGDEQ